MSIAKDEEAITVYELKLDQDGSPSEQRAYVRLPPPVRPYVFRVTIDAGSIASRDGRFMTNYMQGSAKEFDRATFYGHDLASDINRATSVDLLIERSGAFEYYVEHAAPLDKIVYPSKAEPLAAVARSTNDSKRVESRHGYFSVEPLLHVPRRSRILDQSSLDVLPVSEGGSVLQEMQNLTQDGIVLQSFMAKWAGSLSEWAPHLDEASRNGYNMLHFLPLQVRGSSNSPYSIANQLDYSPDLFDEKAGKSATAKERTETVATWIKALNKKWGLLSMIDVVLNHTAQSSDWLYDHPEAAYNPFNSPHLTPAEELDRALHAYSDQLSGLGLPVDPKTDADVEAIIGGIDQHVLQTLRLWEYYAINVAGEKEEFGRAWDEADGAKRVSSFGDDDLGTTPIDDAYKLLERHALRNRMMLSERFTTHIDTRAAVSIFRGLSKGQHSKDHLVDLYAKALDRLNAPLYAIYDDDVKSLKSNLAGRLRYMRIEEGGPRMGPITKQSPFCEDYFTRLDPKDPRANKHDPKELSLANNGWMWAADPLMDFASNKTRVYLRREVIAWGDCVKLRYGSGPKDSPFLWKHMEEYCVTQAKLFDGFRIDNCHSTPLHVGQYLLDASRKANPNLYICAELFTGSEQTDLVFVSKLGINSLIREMENGHDPKEQSRLLYRFGVNKPIGSMDADCLSKSSQIRLPGDSSSSSLSSSPQPCTVVPLEGSSPHALFMDLTHDNETPTRKRTTEDAITMASLVSFSWSAIGSNKGFDDLYPDQLNVVTGTRKYDPHGHSDEQGIRLVRRIFSHLHQEMVHDGYSEGHAHQENDYLMMHRVHPRTHKGYLLITRTAFRAGGSKDRGQIKPFRLNRTDVKFIIGKTLEITSRDAPNDDKYVQGVPSKLIDIGAPQIRQGKDDDGPFSEIVVPDNFPPASIMLFATSMQGLGSDLEAFCQQGASEAVKELDLVDLNVVLYRADAEERDATSGQDGAYTIPDLGQLVYCGTEGFMAHLKHIMRFNDLGHPLCAHLRNGSWALDYVYRRLERQQELFPRLAGLVSWYRERMDKIKEVVPSFMRPKYFSLVIKTVSDAAKAQAIGQMSEFVRHGDDFTKSLALCAVQVNGQVQSASLWHDRPSASMAAGLPFFTTSWARLWGRDVFISLRGLYLTTAMHSAAREHILSFGSTLKHGMIPNLLNSTTSPRYNCRDGPWFFAQNVQDYVNKVPNGESILSEKIKRRFPIDDEWVPVDSPKAFAHVSTVAEIIQEILQRHASGIHFREHGAGPDIDNDMTDKGFNIDVTVDWQTGFVMGGNPHNCGTWQDKMGSSAKAGNKGVPGSPREGAAVEITALLKSTLGWVDSLASKGKWPAKGVKVDDGEGDRTITYAEWAEKIQRSFERCYYVPLDAGEDGKYDVDSKLVNRRGIYKDVYGSHAGREWCDYQLRANYAIAMCVAPELFDPQHGLIALQSAYVALGDVLGMKTLDPQDGNYHPVYDNSNDTDDFWMAKGFCYHNGPPWVFPFGFHLRALLLMSERADKHAGVASGSKGHSWRDQSAWRVMSLLIPHRRHVDASPWAGLPELTNADGAECRDSCPTQAWSASTILDALELIGEQQGTLVGR